jgi:hypothetical protein
MLKVDLNHPGCKQPHSVTSKATGKVKGLLCSKLCHNTHNHAPHIINYTTPENLHLQSYHTAHNRRHPFLTAVQVQLCCQCPWHATEGRQHQVQVQVLLCCTDHNHDS